MDFGKIIIYTSNLRIIRAPPKRSEMMRHHTLPPVELEGYPKARDRASRRRAKALKEGEEKEEKQISDTDTKVMFRGQIILSGVVRGLSPHSCFLFSLSLIFSAYVFSHLKLTLFSAFKSPQDCRPCHPIWTAPAATTTNPLS